MKWKFTTSVLLNTTQHCDFVRELYSKGYTKHHSAGAPRRHNIGGVNSESSAIAEPYEGRFGKGIRITIFKRGEHSDLVVYYIKKESNQLDAKKGRSK
jgi:hypothetical protein